MVARMGAVWPTLGQAVGLAVFLIGLFLVVGLAWTLLVAGVFLLVVSVLAEYTAPRQGWKDGT